jgi:feruloyl-CoA synthase
VLSDAVIAGHDRDEVTAIAWLHPSESRALCGLDADTEVPLDHPVLRAHLGDTLAELGTTSGSAGRVARLILAADPPDLDAGEITDKGYINQRVVLDRRSDLVERLYAPVVDAAVITSA